MNRAIALIPASWDNARKALWTVRLEAIARNEHIRRIEQPVYKRRWDEQWKVQNRWQCGAIAYAREFADAFYWWLSEKAEWWLEKQAACGPIDLGGWCKEVAGDERVRAAWEALCLATSRSLDCFANYFSNLVKDQTVPDNIPYAVPWDKIKVNVPASAKRIRGKLNVPRERFRIIESGQYIWAGVSVLVLAHIAANLHATPPHKMN